MTPDLLSTLANLGAGAVLGWLALPLFARITAVRARHDASSAHRALLSALVLACLLMLVPFARGLMPHDRAAGVAIHVQSAMARSDVAGNSASALGFYFLCAAGAAWSVAAALASALALVSVAQLAWLIRRARPAPGALARAVSLCTAPGTEKLRRILVSEDVSVPFVVVPWSPALVVPATFHEVFDGKALALMIEHEVAHIDRGDLWTNALVRTLCVVFPFHPAAARLANDLAFAREAAVDAQVSRRDPHRYATLLLDVAARARFDQLPKPVSMDDTALEKRIERLTDGSKRQSLSVAPLIITAAILGIASLLAPAVFAAGSGAESAAGSIASGGAPTRPGTGRFRHTPESSYVACRGKSEGDACPFPTPDGDLTGSCTANDTDGRLFCAPPPPPDAPPPDTGEQAPRGRLP
jgi:beta-lactamase regulating signal transducer with metallopeptidase domain